MSGVDLGTRKGNMTFHTCDFKRTDEVGRRCAARSSGYFTLYHGCIVKTDMMPPLTGSGKLPRSQ